MTPEERRMIRKILHIAESNPGSYVTDERITFEICGLDKTVLHASQIRNLCLKLLNKDKSSQKIGEKSCRK